MRSISAKHSAVVGAMKFCQLCSETIGRTIFPPPGLSPIAYRFVVHVPFAAADRGSNGFEALGLVMCVGIGNVPGNRCKNVLIGGSGSLRQDGFFSSGLSLNRSFLLNDELNLGSSSDARFCPAVME